MGKIFLPSCKIKANYKYASKKLLEYLERKEQVTAVGCCKVFCGKIAPEDTAVVVCNNCAAIMEESSAAREIEFVWKIIDGDPDFQFPDYHCERMTIQDCYRAYEKKDVQLAIRSILRKMNIEVVELEENFEKTRFCGAGLLEPCAEIVKKLAPIRYVTNGADMFNPMPREEADLWLRNYCRQIQTETVVCYCVTCLNGIQRGGKKAVHLIDLLFPEQ